jgi:hypothetical protein
MLIVYLLEDTVCPVAETRMLLPVLGISHVPRQRPYCGYSSDNLQEKGSHGLCTFSGFLSIGVKSITDKYLSQRLLL